LSWYLWTPSVLIPYVTCENSTWEGVEEDGCPTL